jgi:prophage tail gpP-like protein
MSYGSVGGVQLQVALNGSVIQGLLHASITSSICFSSDSFSLTFAMGPSPLIDIVSWSALPSIYIEISVNVPIGSNSQCLISGMIDTILVDPIQGTVAIEGRDLSSSLIDAYRQQDFVNQTASEVVSMVALYHGLVPVVTATFGSVGRYYGDGYTRLSLGQFSRVRSDWDLLVQLARENSFDVFVQGTSLFFQPSASSSDLPVHIGLRDVKTMRFEQTLGISSDTTVRVQSWNSQNMTSYDSNGSGDGADAPEATSSSTSSTNNQPFLFSASNFTAQQVSDAAGRYAAELGRLNIMLHIEMPWNLDVAPGTFIFIDETKSFFDTMYRVDSIERQYSTTSGSTQTIRAILLNSDLYKL